MTEDRDGLLTELSKQGIQTRPVWKLIHSLKPYENSQAYEIVKAIYYYDHILNIPCSSNLPKDEVATVTKAILNY